MNYTLFTVGIVLLVLMTVFAIQIIMRTRAMVHEEPPMLEDEISEFQRMRDEGNITEEEFQRLKRVVTEQTIQKAKQGPKP